MIKTATIRFEIEDEVFDRPKEEFREAVLSELVASTNNMMDYFTEVYDERHKK